MRNSFHLQGSEGGRRGNLFVGLAFEQLLRRWEELDMYRRYEGEIKSATERWEAWDLNLNCN